MSSLASLIFFSKNVSVYAIFNDQSFNDMLTNNIIMLPTLKKLGGILLLACLFARSLRSFVPFVCYAFWCIA